MQKATKKTLKKVVCKIEKDIPLPNTWPKHPPFPWGTNPGICVRLRDTYDWDGWPQFFVAIGKTENDADELVIATFRNEEVACAFARQIEKAILI